MMNEINKITLDVKTKQKVKFIYKDRDDPFLFVGSLCIVSYVNIKLSQLYMPRIKSAFVGVSENFQ